MKLPKVSIVIPIYNVEEFVCTSLESVKALSYPTELLEVIVVDDGSTDDSVRIVKKHLDQMPIRGYLIQQKNSGPSSARNRGWKDATGEWIQFLDADDSIEPEKLRIQLSGEWTSDSTIAVVYSRWKRVWGSDGNTTTKEQISDPLIDGDNVFSLLRSENFIQIAYCVLRRDWLERVGRFNESYRWIEDVDLLLRIAMEGASFFHAQANIPLSTYYQRSDSLSNDIGNRESFIDGCVRNAKMVEDYWRQEKKDIADANLEVLIDVYSNALRYYASCNKQAFNSLSQRLLALSPEYQPAGGLPKYLTPLIGYPAAEVISARLRRLLRRETL